MCKLEELVTLLWNSAQYELTYQLCPCPEGKPEEMGHWHYHL